MIYYLVVINSNVTLAIQLGLVLHYLSYRTRESKKVRSLKDQYDHQLDKSSLAHSQNITLLVPDHRIKYSVQSQA